eukprot:6461615-Amphidinium_carterae.1
MPMCHQNGHKCTPIDMLRLDSKTATSNDERVGPKRTANKAGTEGPNLCKDSACNNQNNNVNLRMRVLLNLEGDCNNGMKSGLARSRTKRDESSAVQLATLTHANSMCRLYACMQLMPAHQIASKVRPS